MQTKKLKNNKLELLILMAVFVMGTVFLSYTADAADTPEEITASVDINNTAPAFDVDPYEENTVTLTASTPTTPINVGSSITFRATGDDQDGNAYYLAVCKSDAITAGGGINTPPTCDGGAWCVSTSTADEVATSCQYTALVGDAEESVWYAFVCDNSGDSKCSASSQGTGDSGSPFVVNHRATYTALAVPVSPQDPGSTFTYNATASDTDTYGTTDDNLYLLVCSSSGVTQATTYTAPTCNGTQLNLSAGALTDPTTTYLADLDAGAGISYPDGTYTAYGYVYDQHNLLASAPQTDTWEVNNTAPTVGIDSFNTTTLVLTESTTTNLLANVTVTDNNSCQDITSGGSVVIDFFGGWLAGGHGDCGVSGDSDPDDCYPVVTCTVDSGTNACAGTSDNSVAYDCTVPVQYYAEATGTGSEHVSDNWHAYVTATDDDAVSDEDSATNLNVDLLVAFSAGDSIYYGALDVGDTSTNQSVTVTGTGNTIIDTEVYGTDMTSGGNSILANNQEFDLAPFTHLTGNPLPYSGSPTTLYLGVPKTNWTTSLQIGTAPTYWSLFVPLTTISGSYTGTNTLTAIQGAW